MVYFILVGLDYLGIGFEYLYYNDIGCVLYVSVIDNEVMEVFIIFLKVEGIILVIESVYVLSYVEKLVLNMDEKEIIVVIILGCGDKDMEIIK